MSYPLNSNSKEMNPCRIYQCTKCCVKTEMPLTKDDINRIENLGFEKKRFIEHETSIPRLRNKSGKCIFLRKWGCLIYENRPYGCRLYPLIYNPYEKKFEMDSICPYNSEFKISDTDIESEKKLIETLKKEKNYKK